MFLIFLFLFFSTFIKSDLTKKNEAKGCSYSCMTMDVKYFDKPFIQGLEKHENLYAFLIEGQDKLNLKKKDYCSDFKKVLTDIFEKWYEAFCEKNNFKSAQELRFKIYLLRINYELDLESYQKKVFYQVLNDFKFQLKSSNVLSNVTFILPCERRKANSRIVLEDLAQFEKCFWQFADLIEEGIEEELWIEDFHLLIKAWMLEFSILFFKNKIQYDAFLDYDVQPPKFRLKSFDLAKHYFSVYFAFIKKLKISEKLFNSNALNNTFSKILLDEVNDKLNSYRGSCCSVPMSVVDINKLKGPLIKELEQYEECYVNLICQYESNTVESLSIKLMSLFKHWSKKFYQVKSYPQDELESGLRFVIYIMHLNFRLLLRKTAKQASFCALDSFIFLAANKNQSDQSTDVFINTDSVDFENLFIVTELIFYEDLFHRLASFMHPSKFDLWKSDLKLFFRSWLTEFYGLSIDGNLNYNLFLACNLGNIKISDFSLVYSYFLTYLRSFCRAKLKKTNLETDIAIGFVDSFKLDQLDDDLYKSQKLNLENGAYCNNEKVKKKPSRCKDYVIPDLSIYEGYYEIIMYAVSQASMDNLVSEFNFELPSILEDWFLEFCRVKKEDNSSDLTKIKFALYINEVNLKLKLKPNQKKIFQEAFEKAAVKKCVQPSPLHPGIQVDLAEKDFKVIEELKDFEMLYCLLMNFLKKTKDEIEYFACKNDIKKIIQSWQLDFCKMALSKNIDYGLFESSPMLKVSIRSIGKYFLKYLKFINDRKLCINESQLRTFNLVIDQIYQGDESLF